VKGETTMKNLYWIEMTSCAARYFAVEIKATSEEEARAEATARFGWVHGFGILKVKKEFA
jgi:hypothetical protein